ncbi:MAG: response regulator [Oligoflexia bacterium]|nr:response regulator [Oligoflexia bacterium]
MIKKPYSVLVVDDEEDICLLLQEHLEEKYGEKVVVKTSTQANKALELIENDYVNIVITDMHMPDVEGDQILRKAVTMQRGIQVIIITGMDDYATAFTSFLDGAVGFLRKPFGFSDFVMAVDPCIERLDNWSNLLKPPAKRQQKTDPLK